mmetsp:Transcript_26623/g.50474  ORF Transcript_26623/g.50474 Transcript_26623/m.50474 type:complete len:288 (-) Transcript_26623:28-891(-)|eukprot:CAMPEP_0201625424 /NCGR_PEP_ID=MMETSP0493-20130528/1218_1 /ASSEMBLY_ACC=CAM_ASM_000838 /TAXON_ID=420259 /ORGANISM="Thalassiosira gravida, Strain GMp14c1" /LENGTH=287 /DNA_ID=CAMNT_0048095395 /DNA_START=66 /DNA_END=929 /DNA_ORIENTATION=-
MNAPRRRRATTATTGGQYKLNFIRPFLLAICSYHGLLSHAYSTIPTTSNNRIESRTVPHHEQDNNALNNNGKLVHSTSNANARRHHNNPMGRRTFFQRSTATTTAAAAAIITTTAATQSPQPASAASQALPPLNSPAPPFSLMNTNGKIITLDTLTSTTKWTILYFYPGAFTSGCTIEARKFQEDLPLFQDVGAQVVGVSVDSVSKNSEFCSSEGLDFFMLTDEGGKVSKAYGTSLSIPGFGTFSNRQTYIIDPQKNVRWVFVDVESRIPRHSKEVLEKLKMLQQQD